MATSPGARSRHSLAPEVDSNQPGQVVGQQPDAAAALERPVAGLRLLDTSGGAQLRPQWAMQVVADRGGGDQTVHEVARWLASRGRAFEARECCLLILVPPEITQCDRHFLCAPAATATIPAALSCHGALCKRHLCRSTPAHFPRQALPLYEQLLAKSPDNIEFLMEKGSCYEARHEIFGHIYTHAILILRDPVPGGLAS